LTVDASGTNGDGLKVIANSIGNAFAINNTSGGIYTVRNDGRVAIGNTTSPDYAKLNINMNGTGQAINVYDVTSGNTNKVNFRVDNSGKTIIGYQTQNSNGNHANALCTVNGKFVAREMYVTIFNWSDFVFNKDYKLMPLNEVEQFILKNKHLPDVPSENDIKKSDMNIAEINATLLQKVEELYLYTIDLKKELDAQKAKIRLMEEANGGTK
jgi:hypothetical protein